MSCTCRGGQTRCTACSTTKWCWSCVGLGWAPSAGWSMCWPCWAWQWPRSLPAPTTCTASATPATRGTLQCWADLLPAWKACAASATPAARGTDRCPVLGKRVACLKTCAVLATPATRGSDRCPVLGRHVACCENMCCFSSVCNTRYRAGQLHCMLQERVLSQQ